MTLVCSPLLSRKDLGAIKRYYIDRSASLSGESIENLFEGLVAQRISSDALFGELLRRSILRMYVARPSEAASPAIYHEKFAIFSDEAEALVASGSGNESALALKGSFERFEVFRSWIADERRATLRFESQFQAMLENRTQGLMVAPLFQAYRDGWMEVRIGTVADERAAPMVPLRVEEPELLVPFPKGLFVHQQKAISKWAEAGGKGILAMATGSGKTITSLSIAAQLHDAMDGKPLAILIIAPFIHLVDQWIEVSRQFGLNPIRCAEGEARWSGELSTAIGAVNGGQRRVLSMVATSATLQTPGFQKLLARLRAVLLVIGDEAHNYGSQKVAAALPAFATYRIGLSATPEKWMDAPGTARIESYFGKTVYEYSLEDAIRDSILVPYEYTTIFSTLNPSEVEAYEAISAKLAKFGIADGNSDLSEGAKSLLMKRARILSSTKEKLPKLKELLGHRKHDTHILIYCGDGRVEGDHDEIPPKQIEEVVQIASDLGIVCAKYTADTPPEIRRQILADFDQGRIQALVAIRCLDEGVDVPSTRTAYILSSSTNPRQFVQRRGRVLRKSPSTGKQSAEIFDFFVVPPIQAGESDTSRAMRMVVKNQLQRVMEFSSLALNGPEARAGILDWTKEHGLVWLWGK
ncbi:DEAD/DEAH box helicase family protein [Caulobacter sp. CCNWLY153]|uniref:DEAD/DEAH box helicase family protein n=1 Tax=unclassified Caulobacter TaxID=2648921 RepID=UPI002FF06CEC